MTRNPTPVCRGCGSRGCERLGDLPDSHQFAGLALPNAIPGGALFRCPDCGLVFRSPILTPDEYNRLYAEGSAKLWINDGGVLRDDQQLVKSYIEERRPQGAKVLDIGCYTGEFLSSLASGKKNWGAEKCEGPT